MTKIPAFLLKYSLIFYFMLWGTHFPNGTQDIQNSEEDSATVFYFIRHAEKQSVNKNDRNPDLTEEGHERAKSWATIFKFNHLDAVYSTNYKRTMHTAEPIAASKELPITKLNYPNIPYDSLLNVYKGKSVLFVGHSNTSPEMANHFLGEKRFEQMNEKDYGSLFIVTLGNKSPTAVRLNIN